jgi:hypothetical protein
LFRGSDKLLALRSARGLRFLPVDPHQALHEQVRAATAAASAADAAASRPVRLQLSCRLSAVRPPLTALAPPLQAGHPYDIILHKVRAAPGACARRCGRLDACACAVRNKCGAAQRSCDARCR